MIRDPRLPILALVPLLLPLLLLPAAPASAQGTPGGGGDAAPIHWAFGSLLGTGLYRISDTQSAFVLKIPTRLTLRRSAIGAEGERRVGVELRFPLTLGVLRANSLGGYIGQDTYGTFSITPGLELEIPVTRDWLLRPSFALGWGTELGPTDDAVVEQTAFIFQAGLKSRVHLPIEIGNWGLLGALQYAGYDPNDGGVSDILVATGGLETRQRLGRLFHGPNPLFVESHATYSYVVDLAGRRRADAPTVGLDDFVEVGLAVSQGVVPFRLFGLPIERLGLAFQMSTDTDYRAVKLSFRSPFRM